jgi:hypothetical protein
MDVLGKWDTGRAKVVETGWFVSECSLRETRDMNQDSTKKQLEGRRPGSHEPPSDLNVTWTAVAGVVGAILTFVFIVGIQILFHETQRAEYERQVVSEVPVQLEQLRAQQLERIHTYRMVDSKRGAAAIPIEAAMEMAAREPGVLGIARRGGGQTGTSTQSAPAAAGGPSSQPSGGRSP